MPTRHSLWLLLFASSALFAQQSGLVDPGIIYQRAEQRQQQINRNAARQDFSTLDFSAPASEDYPLMPNKESVMGRQLHPGAHIQTHQHAAGAAACSGEDGHAIDVSREGAASKIHQMVDSCGKTLEIIITAGNMNNVCAAPS